MASMGGAGARCAHGAHRFGQLHPPNRPLQKGTRQQHWHQENSLEMGISSVSCSLF